MRIRLRPCLLICLLASGCADTSQQGTEDGETGSETSSTTGANEPDPELCAPIAIEVLDAAGPRELELLALREDIPGIADQPTARGQILGGLAAFDGRLHLGYGDYSENTGPIDMYAWEPPAEDFVFLGTLPTEEVQWFRPGDGTLYVPATDPDEHQGSGGVYRLDCGSTDWHVGTSIEGAVHVYEVAQLDGDIFVGTGSLTAEPAQVMRSSDHGQSWTEFHRRESPAGKFSRFYFLGATSDTLFMSGRDHPDPLTSFAWTYRNGEFTELVDPPSLSLVPVIVGEDMVIANFSGDPGRGSYLSSYRVEGAQFVPDDPWPQVDGAAGELVTWAPDADPSATLFLFERPGGGASLQRTRDLSPGSNDWEELASLDAPMDDEFVSMALLLNDLYLGSRLGSLYALRGLQAPAG
jgi:hypothetical protein